MSNELGIPSAGDILSNHSARLLELERRVLVLGDNPDEEFGGCCVVLCCNDEPADELEVGESETYCTVTLEESPGEAIRLAINGTVTLVAVDSGQIIADATAEVDGISYEERSSLVLTMAANDVLTIPVVNTIDTNNADPAIGIIVRNLNTPTIRVQSVNLQVLVYGVRDGSTACGEPVVIH